MGNSAMSASEGSAITSLLTRADVALYALLAAAVVIGGGGVGYGYFNLIVQLAALVVLALHRKEVVSFLKDGPRGLVLLVIATLVLPLLQLVPLPPGMWSLLPGRDLVGQSLELVGATDDWMQVSVDPNRTALGFIALLPAFAVLALGWSLGRSQARLALQILVGLALFGLALGALQLASANLVGNWYPGGHPQHLYGTFANHNSTGIFLVIAMLALAGLPPNQAKRKRSVFQPLWTSLFAALAVGVILTQSRSSAALLVVPAVFLVVRSRFGGSQDQDRPGKPGLMIILPLALLFAGGGYLLLANEKVQQTFERFDELENRRPEIWQDSLVAIDRFWPIGSGVGTFDEVYQVDESLEHVAQTRAGRAHNDYLELAIESGIAGVALLLAWLAWLGLAAWQAKSRSDPLTRLAAAAGLGCVVLQSVLDYPLRNEALLCVAAMLVALLARNRAKAE